MADIDPAELEELRKKAKILEDIMGRTSTNFNTLGTAFDKAMGPFSALVSATSSGATGMSAYNSALDAVGKSAADITKNFPILGSAINAMAGVGMEYVKAVNVQNDELYKSYQGLSKIGLAGEANTDSLLKMAQQFGVVNDKQLPQFTQMLASNSETLAKFGGTAAQGVKTFADMSENIQRTGVQTQLLNMGMSVESINTGMANYLKIQQQSGGAMQRAGEDQRAYTARLAAGAEDYIKQMDTLSKLTGKSADALVKEQEEALLNEQYSIHQRELQQKADAGDIEAQKQLVEEQKVMSSTEGSVRKGFMAAFTGMGMQFEEGRKLYQSAPEAFNQAAKGTGVQANQILDTAKGEFKKTMDTFGSLIMATGNTLFANVKDMRSLENQRGSAEERTVAALAQQKKQIENTDESIKAQTATLQLQRDAQKELQNMIHAGSAATSYLMLKLAEATKTQAGRLPNADGTQGMDPAQKAAELEKAKIQMRSQGVGGLPDEKEGKRRSEQIATTGKAMGKPTETQIYEKAVKEMAEFVPALKAATEKAIADAAALVGRVGSDVTSEIVEQLRNSLRNLSPLPNDRPNPNPPGPTPRGFSENLEELGAAQNQAGPSAASMRYRERVNPDVAQQLSGPTADEFNSARSKFAGLPEKTSNEELIASNVLLEKKMDELIDISRASRSYLEKISNQAYA
jgi:hypothetical protein